MAAKSSLCGLLALLCAASLLSSIGAEQLSAAAAIVEARNDEAALELPQPQADIALAEPLPAKPALSEMPILPVEVNDKQEENVGKAEGSAPEQELSSVQSEGSKKENLELAINAEVLKQPGMARLARKLKSFHNYQVYRAQKYAVGQRDADFDDDEGGDLEAEERAIRRRKRVRRRNANNNVRRAHKKKNVANRQNSAHRQNQRRKSVPGQRQDANDNAKYRPVSSNNNKRRRGSSNSSSSSSQKTKRKSPRRTSSGKRRRSSTKKGSSQTKRKSPRRKRTNRNSYRGRNYAEDERDVNSYRLKTAKAPQMFVIVDDEAREA